MSNRLALPLTYFFMSAPFKKVVFRSEFARRVNHFISEVERFQKTGRVGSLIPALYSLVSFVWMKRSEDLFKEVTVSFVVPEDEERLFQALDAGSSDCVDDDNLPF